MELKEFIKTALAEIVEAINEAGDELKKDVAMCYHTDREYNGYPSVSYTSAMRERQAPMTVVDFKVRVQVSEENSTEKNVKGGVLRVLSAGVSDETLRSGMTTQELSFSIPMVWRAKK